MSRKRYPLDGKTIFGLSTMRWIVVAAQSMMTAAFMLYLTDYSGLANAAAVATILLLAGRILDAVDDPIQGWIMDNSRRTRIGKFKPFFLGGIAVCAIALVMLFNVPMHVSETLKIVYLAVGYILYEIGYSFQSDVPIKISLSPDPKVREKTLVVPRVVETFVAIPFSFFITIALALGASLGSNHAGWGAAALALVAPMFIMAMLGASLVREGPYAEAQGDVKLKEIITMFRQNKPMWIIQLAQVIFGLTFSFIMAAASYYIKWAYGPEQFGVLSAVWGATILFSFVIGTSIAPVVLKKSIPINSLIFTYIGAVIPLALVFILGLFNTTINVTMFLALNFVALLFIGMSYIPATLVNMETMDFNKVTGGKAMEAMVTAVSKILEKAAAALAGLATGAVLVWVQYDAALYESQAFIDAGGTLPAGLLRGLLVVIAAIPAVFSLIAALILFAYPIKGKVREEMYTKLAVIRQEATKEI